MIFPWHLYRPSLYNQPNKREFGIMLLDGALNILLVEDEEADARLTVRELRDHPAQHSILWVKDGDQALQAMAQEGAYAKAKRPDVILLDLNLPKTDGHKVLSKLKSDRSFKSIPVFVLTSSRDDADIERTFLSWADSYIVKPMKLTEFESAVAQLRSVKQGAGFVHS